MPSATDVDATTKLIAEVESIIAIFSNHDIFCGRGRNVNSNFSSHAAHVLNKFINDYLLVSSETVRPHGNELNSTYF